MSSSSQFDLSGKKALVTGAAGGIGKASAIAMAKAGADIAIVDLKEEMANETVEEIKAMGRKAVFIKCDVSDPVQVAAMVKNAIDALGGLHIAHNNAGILGAYGMPLMDDHANEAWKQLIDTDLSSVFYCCREEAKYMIPQRYGKIVNTASMSATIINDFPGVQRIAYCVAKAGVKHLTKALAAEFVQYNIYVNSISPGYIMTPMYQEFDDPEVLKKVTDSTPIKRLGESEEMAGGVLYLVSDASSFTTGHDLVMDGGYSIW